MMLWSRAYHLAILFAITVLALLYFAAQRGLKAFAGYLGHPFWADIVCLTWMVFVGLRTMAALLVRLEQLPGVVSQLLWSPWTKLLLYVVLPIPIILLYPVRAKLALRQVFTALSLLVVFFMTASASWTTFEKYNATLDEAVAAHKISTGRNFLVFIMDEWSPSRTFGVPDWRERFPALAELIDQSTYYTQAYSLGGETRVSLPRLLFSNDPRFMHKSFKEVYSFNENGLRPDGPTLFDLVPNEWLRLAIGFTINYPVILANKTDLALRFESENVRRTFRGEFRILILSQFSFLRVLGIRYKHVVDPDWFPQMEIHQYVLEVLRTPPTNMMGFFHYCWPHYPYIWNHAGRKSANISPLAAKEQSVENYMDNLAYMNVVIGEICQVLRQSGRWDDSVVVFTSDHNWRFDPAQPPSESDLEDSNPTSAWKHVPLIIKYPGQKTGRIESEYPVSQGNLQHLLHAYVAGDPLPEDNEWLNMKNKFID